MRVEAEPAYVLHTRPYRETSQLVELFTFNYGRIRAVAKGSRGRAKGRGTLFPFVQLSVGWGGRGELKSLYGAESDGYPIHLQGEQLYTGFYLNELLLRTLPEQDAHQAVFHQYSRLLHSLAGDCELQPLLRQFELTLLQSLGYELVLDTTADTCEPVKPGRSYGYSPQLGLLSEYDPRTHTAKTLYDGGHLLAIARSEYSDASILHTAKRLLRTALAPHLGDKPLQSRELFRQARKIDSENDT
ncbi:DNA repair protein RecO [bacterium SCSIO 12696]|nr:DNA repair protein RecO [bacterium SCSIO 12696]